MKFKSIELWIIDYLLSFPGRRKDTMPEHPCDAEVARINQKAILRDKVDAFIKIYEVAYKKAILTAKLKKVMTRSKQALDEAYQITLLRTI